MIRGTLALTVLLALVPANSQRVPSISNPMAPDFTVKDLDGREVKLRDYRNKVVIVNFFSAWCMLCAKETSNLTELQQKYEREDVTVIGLSDDADLPGLKNFYSNYHINYVVAIGNDLLEQAYGNTGIPSVFVLGRDGRVYYKHPDYVPGPVLEKEVQGLIRAKTTEQMSAVAASAGSEKIEFPTKEQLNTDIPGLDLSEIAQSQLRQLEQGLDKMKCTCGCGKTILSCRRNHWRCQLSLSTAKKELSKISTTKK